MNEHDAIKLLLRGLAKPLAGGHTPIALQRRGLAITELFSLGPATVRDDSVGTVRMLRVASGEPPAPYTILYLHGGGYAIGSARGYRPLASYLARVTGAEVVVPDYRLAPEHPAPAGLEDALTVYRELAAQGPVVIAGDSAGGGLTLASAVAIRDAGLSAPRCLVLFSPWLDLRWALSGAAPTGAASDPFLPLGGLARWARIYCRDLPASDPRCSPLLADLAGLPPAQIQYVPEEILGEDCRRFVERARAAGVAVDARQWPGMWHAFQAFTPVAAAREAVQAAAAFIAAAREPAGV